MGCWYIGRNRWCSGKVWRLTIKKVAPNKRVESGSLRRRFAPPPLAAHAQRWADK
jgi:hypothetical protein